MTDERRNFGIRTVALAALAGVVIYASMAYSMKSTDQARFCGSCHVMWEQTRSHQASGHAKIACNECHAPEGGVSKMVFKAKSGTRDVYENTLGTVYDVIHATKDTKAVVDANCKRCHEVTTLNVNMQAKEYCTDCHRHVPHMGKRPIATRSAANE